MAQTDEKNKFHVSPTDRIDVLFALTKEQAKEQEKAKVKGKEYQKSLEQVDVLVMLALIGHRNNKTGQCDPSHALIAREIGVSVSTVQRSFKRLEAAGFQTTSARSFKGLKTSSQVDIQFQKGQPWIAKSDDARSRMTDRSVTDDTTIGHGCHSRSVTDDANARSRMTDEHSALNSENEHSEPNTPSAPRREGPVDGLIVDGGDEAPPASKDHQSGETEQDKPVQDNQKDDGRLEQYRKAGEEIWLMFHKAKPEDHDEFIRLFVELAQSGEIKNSKEVRYGLMCHLRDTEPKWQKSPVNFMKKRGWKEYRAGSIGAVRPKMAGAI